MRRVLWNIVCTILFFISGIVCAPLPQEKLPSKETENFMKKFGYIESGPNAADAMYSVEGFTAAVQLMQRFGGLPETGELDDATLNLTKSPRCGVPDVIKNHRQKRYIIGSKAWKKRGITYFLANWPGDMDPEVTRAKLAKALHMWSEVTPLKFQPHEGMDADLIIAFGRSAHGDGYPFDGQGNVLAHAFFPYEHGPYGGDIHFDDDEEWVDASIDKRTDGVDFFTVASHEIGHSLGLAHSTVPGSIMFPYYKGYDPYMRLDYDDIVAVYSIYDNNFEDEPVNSPSSEDESERKEDDKDDSDKKENNDGDETEDDYSVNNDIPSEDDDLSTEGTEPTATDYDYSKSKDSGTTTDTFSTEKATPVNPTKVPSESTVKPTVLPKKPDLCNGSIDAASLIREELFVFKGFHMWRFSDQNQILPNYPVYFHDFFTGFPWSVRSIDAVYQRPEDYHIIFFTGRNFWDFDGNRFTPDSPRQLTDLGLPSDLGKVDAAIVWAKNKKTYFFSGDLYWRFDETRKAIEKGYPQRLARWKGLPELDTAFTWKDGKTYFFKDKQFWRFNNKNISIDAGFPLETGPYWFDCNS